MKDEIRVERTYHRNGRLASEVPLVNGLPNGVARYWFFNGVLAFEAPMKDGKEEGVVKQWNEKGEFLGSYEMRNGCGVKKSWHPNGQLQFEHPMLNGKETGLQRSYYSNGQIEGEVTLVNGLPVGVTRHWLPNGILSSEIPVKDGRVEGVVKQWNYKGELLGSYEIRNGCGISKSWHPNGHIASEFPMLHGKLTGRASVWWEDGALAGDTFYIEDRKVSKKKYAEICEKNPNLPRYEDFDRKRPSLKEMRRIAESLPKDRVNQSFHFNGQLAQEIPIVNGLPNGIKRSWYPNGVLEFEIPMKDGIEEGVAKQWNDLGEFLGSYEIRKGCGIQKRWFPNGQVQFEAPMLNGMKTGRHRFWSNDGTLEMEFFWIEDQQVSKKQYLEACEKNPGLPAYEEISGEGPSLPSAPPKEEPRPFGTMSFAGLPTPDIEELLKSPQSKEALSWLESGKPESRALGELPTTAASIEMVQELYALGATRVTAMEIYTYDTGEENTGKLIVSVPDEPSIRAKVFEWCAEQAELLGYAPEPDVGQAYIFVMLD